MKRFCQVTDCGEPHHANGLCHTHNELWRQRRKKNPDADPQELRPDRREEIEREGWIKAWLYRGKLQALDAEHRGRRLSPEAWQHWQRLERELDEVEHRIGAALEAVADAG